MARVRERLRCGFSTGTAAAAAARAAVRHLVADARSQGESVAVRLPSGAFLAVPICGSGLMGQGGAWARVVKDGGDDPDVTHGAVVEARVRWLRASGLEAGAGGELPTATGVCLVAGEGVGVVTKSGLPVEVGEPAVNPVPRLMLSANLSEELLQRTNRADFSTIMPNPGTQPGKPFVLLPFPRPTGLPDGLLVEVEIIVPRGQELARHTLNPRLGIVGGISILGTTGLVKPFSHDAYRETIQAALAVAVANGGKKVLFSTGGKSERLARRMLPDWPDEAFVQIADFFAFALEEARRLGFEEAVLSVFFGKAVKMAQGHAYTHAHTVSLDLDPLARQGAAAGYEPRFCRQLAEANTAREALSLLLVNHAEELIQAVGLGVLEQASGITGRALKVRLLLFDYEGNLLFDLEGP